MLGSPLLPHGNRGGGSFQHNGTWGKAGDSWVNTPVLGGNLIQNPGFDTASSWGLGPGWSISGGQAHHSGSGSLVSQSVVTSRAFYYGQYTLVSLSTGKTSQWFGTNQGEDRTIPGTYETIIQESDHGYTGVRSDGIASIDDVVVKPLTFNQLYLVTAAASPGVVRTKLVSPVAVYPMGVVAYLDSLVNPQNFILAYRAFTGAYAFKCVNGVWTQLISTSGGTFVSGALFELRRPSGNSFEVWYNGVKRGSTTTINDESILSNSLHGGFSTHPLNELQEIVVL